MPTMELASGRTFDPNGKSFDCLVNRLHAWASTLLRVILTLGFILITWPSIWFIYQIDFLIDKTQPPRGRLWCELEVLQIPARSTIFSQSTKLPRGLWLRFRARALWFAGSPLRRSAPLLKEASFKFLYDMRLFNFSFQFSLPCAARSFRLIFFIRYDLAPFQVFKFRSPCGLPPFKFVGLSWQFLTPKRCSTKSTVSEWRGRCISA